MDEPDQSPLVTSSSSASPAGAADEQERWKAPQQPRFQYQFVRDEEEEEPDEEDDEEEEEVDDERLEVRERKPAAAAAAAATTASSTPFAAVPPPAAVAATASLLDLGTAGEQHHPASPPPVPPPTWASSHPTVPSAASSSSPSLFAADASPPEEKGKEPPRSAPPAPPLQEEPYAPAVPPRSAPLPPKKEESPVPAAGVAAKKSSPSGSSPDESPFTLHVASEPLMQPSADKGMNLQEQLGRACSASQEDFAAAPLGVAVAAASLPSFSSLSANPFKEYAALDSVSDGLSGKGRDGQIENEALQTATKNARNPFLADEDSHAPKLSLAGVASPYTGSEPFFLSHAKDPEARPDPEKLPPCTQDPSPPSPVETFGKREKDVSPGEKNGVIDKVAFVDGSGRDEYVDFKAFEPLQARTESSEGTPAEQVDSDAESGVDDYSVEKDKTSPAQKDHEKGNESSNDDISFPSTPETSKESPQAYVACAKLETGVAAESSTAKAQTEEQASENKTDEKKIAEMKAHFGTESSVGHIELAGSQREKADYDKAEAQPEKPVDTLANMPEGLTPDLVQEAYESQLHDSVSPKLSYETKIDLVQTSEPSQEPGNAAVQLCPSFEGGPEAAPSPVLPDIVMEAPLNSNALPPTQTETSALKTLTDSDNYENVMQKSEKPPSYQEAMNVASTQVQETKVEEAGQEAAKKNDVSEEDLEASYISIACDLVKETKVSSEPPAVALMECPKAMISECIPQPLEKPSQPSAESSLFSGEQEPKPAQKEEVVKEEPLETIISMVPKEALEEQYEEVSPSLAQPYLESFQPPVEPSKHVPTAWSLEVESTFLAKKETPPQLPMDKRGTSVDDFPVSKEPTVGSKIVLSAESSPEADFPPVPSQPAELKTGAAEKDTMMESKQREPCDVVKSEVRRSPDQEIAQDLSLKNVHIKIEKQDVPSEKTSEKLEKEVPEVTKEPLPLAEVAPLPPEKKVDSVGKEPEKDVPLVKGKEKSPPVFPSQLSKPSVVDLLYWRDVKKTGVVFGVSLFLLLSLTVFSIVSVVAYIALALLSVTISFRIYKGVIQAIQKSDEGHPFRAYLDKDVAMSEELVQKYSHAVLGHFNNTVKELRRLFLVDDLVDSLKFAVLMWVFTYVGALFNGLTLLILALISLFSIPVIYEKHQAQIDHYVGLVNKNIKDAVAKIQAKIPGLKRKTE